MFSDYPKLYILEIIDSEEKKQGSQKIESSTDTG